MIGRSLKKDFISASIYLQKKTEHPTDLRHQVFEQSSKPTMIDKIIPPQQKKKNFGDTNIEIIF